MDTKYIIRVNSVNKKQGVKTWFVIIVITQGIEQEYCRTRDKSHAHYLQKILTESLHK